jgi:hypothetical protein
MTLGNVDIILKIARALLSIAGGAFGGWWLIVGICSIPGIKFSLLCGHNAFIGLLPAMLIVGALCWAILAPLVWIVSRSNGHDSGDPIA